MLGTTQARARANRGHLAASRRKPHSGLAGAPPSRPWRAQLSDPVDFLARTGNALDAPLAIRGMVPVPPTPHVGQARSQVACTNHTLRQAGEGGLASSNWLRCESASARLLLRDPRRNTVDTASMADDDVEPLRDSHGASTSGQAAGGKAVPTVAIIIGANLQARCHPASATRMWCLLIA